MELNKLNQNAVLLLEDGTVFKGKRCGSIGTKIGEVNFVVGMTGFQEIFTDPSNHGQILVTTNTHIGNYGVLEAESASDKVQIVGLVCNEFAIVYSRPKADMGLQELFDSSGTVGVEDVDTRTLVRHIRNHGTMLGILSSEILDIDELKQKLSEYKAPTSHEQIAEVSTREIYTVGNEDAKYKVAVLDLGVRRNLLSNLVKRDALIKVFPYNTSLDEIKKFNPDAYLFPNGPGNPNNLDDEVALVTELIESNQPVLGIGLGCQLIAKAMGVDVYKLKHGHRGDNHPVRNVITDKSETTIQSHSFQINNDQAEKSDYVRITHVNLNDKTVEGISVIGKKAYGVQFSPIIYTDLHDSEYIYNQLFELI